MTGLILPATACPHPKDELRCDIRTGASVRIFVQCGGCTGTWTERTVPGAIIDKLQQLLDEGRIRAGVL